MKAKNIMIIMGILTLTIISAGCTDLLKTPHLELNTYKYDMGNVKLEDGIKELTFTVKNTGEKLLNITYISTSCGCTTAEVKKNILKPGEKTDMIVRYDPSVHPDLRGKLKRIIYIESNDPKNEETELEITGKQISENDSEIKETTHIPHKDNVKEFEISPYNAYEEIIQDKIKVLDVREQSEYNENHIEGTLLLSVNNITQESLDKLGLKKDDEIIIYCRSGSRSARAYELMHNLGYTNIKSMAGGIVHWMEEGFPTESGNPDDNNQSITNNFSSGEVYLPKNTHDFGMVYPANGVINTTFEVVNNGTGYLNISTISTSCGCTSATINKNNLKPGENAILTVFFDPNFHKEPLDKFSRTVFIETNDPNNPEIEVKIFIDIKEEE